MDCEVKKYKKVTATVRYEHDMHINAEVRNTWIISNHKFYGACQISERLEKSKPESRGFETFRDLVVRRPSA